MEITENTPELTDQPEPSPVSPLRDYLILLFGAGTIIALDTWTKHLVDKNIPVNGAWLPDSMAHLMEYFRVVHVHNRGSAFSMFDGVANVNTIIGILAAAVSVFIVVIFPRIERSERVLRAAIVLQLGGTIGNLISRVQYGYVVDFISIWDFAVFNIADASLVVGAGIMILAVLVEEIRERREKKEEELTSLESEELPEE